MKQDITNSGSRKSVKSNFKGVTRYPENILAQQSLYVSIVNSSDDAIISKTLDGIIMSWNPAAERIFGYTEKEALGRHISMIIPEDLLPEEAEIVSKISRGEYVQHYETKRLRKDSEQIFVSLTVSPVITSSGEIIGASKIARDITAQKIEEGQKTILSAISQIFSEPLTLDETLQKTIEYLVDFGNFLLAEVWLIGHYKMKINQKAGFSREDKMKGFFAETSGIKNLIKGEGLPGIVWETGKSHLWRNIDKNKNFVRGSAAKRAGIKAVFGLPLYYHKEVVGVLILGSGVSEESEKNFSLLSDNLGRHFGAEIKRKQLEEENNQIFSLAPDIICTAGVDGYFKKINPAMCKLLGYTEEELLNRPFLEFVHPGDRNPTTTEIKNMVAGSTSWYFENRYITKSGKIKWLAWTATAASEEGLLFCVAKDITDKKDLVDLLHKATTLARIGSWEWDLINGKVYWSDITKEIHEVEPDFTPVIESVLSFFKGENNTRIVQLTEEAVNNGSPCDAELQIVTAKGNTKWVRVISEVEFTEGICGRIYGSLQDIDARKKAEVEGKKALEERNVILESIDDAFFAVDKNWMVTYWNSMAEKIFRKSRGEVVNHSLLEEFPHMVDTKAYKYYCQVIDTGRSAHFEYYSSRYDLWLDANVYPGASGFTVYMKNITARKNAESSAMAALEERNTILESIDDAFFAVDKSWVVTYWNNTAEKVLQTPKSEILEHNLWEVFADSIDSESYKKYHEAVETNHAVHFEDYYAALNKWYEISAYPSGTGLSVYFKDITDRKTSEARLLELNETLQKHAKELSVSNAELEQFAYVASHDLQEPLRMVTSFMTQLEKKYSDVVDDKGRQYIHFAVDGAKRMRQIILDLLEFSRVGRTENDLEEVDFNKLVNEILTLYRKQIEDKHAWIDFANLPTFQTYRTPVRQVLQNLIGNSLKYQEFGKPPVINISCSVTKTYWQFAIKDNGIGIDPEYFNKIFIIFQRLHNKDEYSGTGMGLAIAKKIVENMGGKIWVESAEGKGSTFYFTIVKNTKT